MEMIQIVQINTLGSCMAPPQGLKLYIVIYREMLKKYSSQELLHQILNRTEFNMEHP